MGKPWVESKFGVLGAEEKSEKNKNIDFTSAEQKFCGGRQSGEEIEWF